MEPKQYFIIYLTDDDIWKVGTQLMDSFEEAKKYYEEFILNYSKVLICETIYG